MVISSQRRVALLSRFTQVSRLSRASRVMTRRSSAPSLRTSRPPVQVRTAGLQAKFQKLFIGDSNSASSSSETSPARSPRISPLQPSRTSTILSLLAFSRRASVANPIATGTHAHTLGSARTITYGMEYQPSQRIRKRRHGFLARIKSRGGRKVLIRRRAQGRKHISH